MYISACYYYYGSSNCSLRFEKGENEGTINLITDYGEKIATVSDVVELQKVLDDLKNDKYDRP